MTQEKYIYENCSICGEYFENVEDIMVDLNSDRYICLECSEEHNIRVVNCLHYTEDDIED